jgi:hypothetical protein
VFRHVEPLGVLFVQLGHIPRPGSRQIEQLTDHGEVRTDHVSVLVIDVGQDADGHVQSHG